MTTALETMPEPITEETAFLVTDAGIDALRNAPIVPDDDAPDAFTPDTPEKADWVLSKIADARARAARIRENMEMMAREAERDAEHLEWRFGAALQAFTRSQTEGGRKKSVRLPNGVLGYRTKPAGVQIADDRAALSWAKANLPAAVSERLDRAAITKALLTTGEAVPFASFTLPEETFYIK